MEGGERGEKNWDNCNSIINKIYLKKESGKILGENILNVKNDKKTKSEAYKNFAHTRIF